MNKLSYIAIALIFFGFGCAVQPIEKTAKQIETEQFLVEPNDIMVENQTAGQTVVIAETKFTKPGFLAIIELNDGEETVLGYSPITPIGYRQNRKIALTTILKENQTYTVRMYDDTDEDTEFKLSADKPLYRPGTENIIQKTFTIFPAQ